MPYIEGAMRYYSAGAPVAAVDAVQQLAFTGAVVSTGTFTLVYGGIETAPITGNATPATIVGAIDAALEAHPLLGSGSVTTAATTYTAGAGNITVTFNGPSVTKKPIDLLTVGVNNLTGGPTLTITTLTAGVRPVPPFPATGAQYTNLTSGVVSSNTGTPLAPTWTALS